jgi:DedD protein
MAERIADNADLMVDDMRRKARRRLVGAIVLALAAAIVLPMLLEKEPRPLGDDVSVQIPPVDQGKFVNRLTGKGETKAPAKSDAKPIGPTGKADGKVDGKTEGANDASPSATATATPPKAETPVAAKAEPAAAPKADGAIGPRAEIAGPREDTPAPAAPDSKAATKSAKPDGKPAETATDAKPSVAGAAPPSAATGPVAAPASPAAAKPDGAFVVQLAAFADDKGANALAGKLKKSGYAAYVEPISTSRGTLWRVRVGGYGTRPEADAARVALKGEGYSGIIAPSQ